MRITLRLAVAEATEELLEAVAAAAAIKLTKTELEALLDMFDQCHDYVYGALRDTLGTRFMVALSEQTFFAPAAFATQQQSNTRSITITSPCPNGASRLSIRHLHVEGDLFEVEIQLEFAHGAETAFARFQQMVTALGLRGVPADILGTKTAQTVQLGSLGIQGQICTAP